MVIDEPLVAFAMKIVLGFLVGALIGLERERARIYSSSREPRSLPGVRSFGLLSLYGTMIAQLGIDVSMYGLVLQVFVVALSLLIIVMLYMYIYFRFHYYKVTGITTLIVIAISLSLGFMVGLGHILEAISASIFVTTVLAIKPSIKSFVKKVSYKELLSGLELGLFAFIIGPFFLTKPVVVYGIDISKIYLLFLTILTLSFVSYIAVKLKGTEAIRYIALLGGLVNSEATLVNIATILSRHSDIEPRVLRRIMSSSVFITLTSMLVRNMIIIVALLYTIMPAEEAHRVVAIQLLPTVIVCMIGFYAWNTIGVERLGVKEISIENPLSLKTAIRVVLVYAAIFALGYAFISVFGASALLPVSLVGGFVNAGAAILMILTLSTSVHVELNIIAASLLVANVAAIFNKIFFVRTAVENSDIYRATVYSVIVASAPLLVLIVLLLALRVPSL